MNCGVQPRWTIPLITTDVSGVQILARGRGSTNRGKQLEEIGGVGLNALLNLGTKHQSGPARDPVLIIQC
jgi:hypothetical protein